MIRRRGLLLATPAILAASRVRAAETVKVGVLFPLTGNSAASGGEAKAAVEVAAGIVNTAHPELKDLPLGATAGLPNLGGARIEPIFVDHRGDPSVAQSLAQRLIISDKVTALFGSYQSSTAMTATAVAERYGVPFVVADSVAANITGRGFRFTFRVTPVASNCRIRRGRDGRSRRSRSSTRTPTMAPRSAMPSRRRRRRSAFPSRCAFRTARMARMSRRRCCN
jgi:branched-chain amino acid transport system substrate-binding protein